MRGLVDLTLYRGDAMELKARWNGCDVYLYQGDITRLDVDAVVNAANPWLAGGGGVDGAIHRAGGPAILAECRRIMAERNRVLDAGDAVLTTGGDLPARHVVHTVGPVYRQAGNRAADQLAACYRASLRLVRENGLRSLAVPCISTGAYGYPSAKACRVAVRTVRDELERDGGCDRVVFCTFEEDDYQLYEAELGTA